MTGSSHDPADRTVRAVAAAAEAGRERGLAVTEPVVLYDVFSVVVHLAPSPVVVRVPTVLPVGSTLETQAAGQREEIAVVEWLAAQGCPVVVPSPLVAAEPVERDGFSMTFWQWADHRPPAEPDWTADTAPVADLHLAMRDYAGPLRFLPFLSDVPAAFGMLATRPDLIEAADLDRAQREWEVLAPVVTTSDGLLAEFGEAEIQPVHGDSPTYNLIKTPEGPLYSDFELACLGPIEWDLTLLEPAAVAAYTERAGRLGLRAPDERLLRVMEATRMLQVVAVLSMVPQLPMMAEALKVPLGHWRSRPFAGGLGS
ncbi:phosphotransferase [Phytomonospora sp. NPDC050363]|uniref:phosphotransferase n=1 Tax=Phytomonospora sp. NPDC050363 TaxID=3155642 RepID=UPI0033CED859